MPVLKIKKNGVWEDVAGISGHTHELDEITNFPTSAAAGDLLMYDGTNWVNLSKADLIAEIIITFPSAEEASF